MRGRWIAVTIGALVVGAAPAIAAHHETALRSAPAAATPARTAPAAGQRTVTPVVSVGRATVTRPGIKWTARGVRYAVWIP